MDSFLNLFKDNQRKIIKTDSRYDEFMRTIEAKNQMPLDALDTKEELDIAESMIEQNIHEQTEKIA